jgi:type IV pilus assembly protein PilB
MILIVGPTGAGKSTTLYAGLLALAQDDRLKVITIEDPVEYRISGAQQTAIDPARGIHFADAMRVLVREDPDVIMIGEIRDTETALEAVRASQTGHLVLSTLHCSDTIDAMQRLTTLGVEPLSLASELQAVIAQRLAKRICVACRMETAADPARLWEIFRDKVPSGFQTFKGRGCNRCRGTGYRGRVGVYELLPLDDGLRHLLCERRPLDDYRAAALHRGFRSLRAGLLDLVAAGVTTIEAMSELLSPERLAPDPDRSELP